MFRRGKKPMPRSRLLRERANMSFFIVVMFFAVFGVIVLTEIFLIDERDRGSGGGGGRRARAGRHHGLGDRPDYDDAQLLQGDDYTIYRVGFDESLGVFIREERGAGAGAGAGAPKGAGEAGRGGKAGAESLLQPLIVDAVRALPEAGVGPGAAGAVVPPGGLPAGVEARLPPLNASLPARDGTWQFVSGTRYKFFVYSAFYDRRESRTLRIIAATKTRGPDRVWCRLWYNGTAPVANGNASASAGGTAPHSISVAAKIKAIRENWNLKYSAVFVLCPLGRSLPAPALVSVVSRLRLPPANLLLVRNTDADLAARNLSAARPEPPPLPPHMLKDGKGGKGGGKGSAAPLSSVAHIPDTIAVCVKPLHYNYNRVLNMLEFLELYALLGVQHFTLYNHTLGPQVGCVLRDYAARGTVTLLPWQLNMVSQKEIRTEALFAALNDCLYRSMYQYAYTALVDLDEYIIPRNHDTLPELVKWLGTRMNTRGTGSYSFQNAFFYLQWADDPGLADSDQLQSGLVTLRKTRRRSKLHPHKQRSKYLCRPDFVVEAGNHFVWEFVPGHGTLNVPPDAAILHHYRVCEFGGDDCIKSPSVVDKTAYRYRERLTERVRQRYRQLQIPCELPPLVEDPLTPAPTPPPPADAAPARTTPDDGHPSEPKTKIS